MSDTPQHIVWDDVDPTPLYDFGDRASYKALTGSSAQILRVKMGAGVVFPNPNDPSEQETHPNEQISNVVSGRMKLIIDGVEHIVGPGESITIPSNLPHSAEFLEDTEMIEVFIPPFVGGVPTNEARD